MLVLVEGPAGAGKSQVTRSMREAGSVDIVADVTDLWVALAGVRRGPDGRYPIRRDNEPALHAARYLQAVAVHFALKQNADVAVTSSRPDQARRWRDIAEDAGTTFEVRTVTPDEAVVRERLAKDGELSEECDKAINRWFKNARR